MSFRLPADLRERRTKKDALQRASTELLTMRSDRRGRRWVAGLAGLLILNGGAWLIASQVRSADQAASLAKPPRASWVTASVQMRTLSQTVIARGEVQPEMSVSVGVPESVEGPGVITALGATSGEMVFEGSKLLEVSGRPIFVFQGDVPMYRTLKPSMTGSDVSQLQAALARTGCDATAEGGTFGTLTKLCVAKLYSDAGFDTVRTSPGESADLAAGQAALDQAQQAVTSAQSALSTRLKPASDAAVLSAEIGLRAAQRGYDDAVAAAASANVDAAAAAEAARTDLEALRAQGVSDTRAIAESQATYDAATRSIDDVKRTGASTVAAASDALLLAHAVLDGVNSAPEATREYADLLSATAARDAAQAALDALQASTGPTIPLGEVVFVEELPARVRTAITTLGPIGGSLATVGPPSLPGGGDGSALETVVGDDLMVATTIRAIEIDSVRPGLAAEILDELSGDSYPATVTGVAAEQTVGADGQAGYAAIVVPAVPLPQTLIGANVRLTITSASTKEATLVVPTTAVSSAADGTTFVSVVPLGADVTTIPMRVEVVAGLSADGFVSVRPVDSELLAEGDNVVVGK